LEHGHRKDAKYAPAVEPFVRLRFRASSGWLATDPMDPSALDPNKPDNRARRAKLILYVLMFVLIVGPIVIYFLIGRRTAPTQ
jgi:hypothetical protein